MSSTLFQEAQARLAARRSQREAAERQQSLKTAHLASSHSIPFPLNLLSRPGWTLWNSIEENKIAQPAFRVGQVDAEILDEELIELLKSQAGDALKYYGPHLRDDWSPEITLLLRSILFKLSVWDNNSTYGAALQNLQFIDGRQPLLTPQPPSKWQKGLYGLVTVGGHYAWQKWDNWLVNQRGSIHEPSPMTRQLSKFSAILETSYSAASLVSFLIFLVNGQYRALIDRILRMRLLPKTSHIAREISFEYLNRQLVWHSFTEFLLFVLPLIGISRWKRWIARAWRKLKSTALRHKNAEESLEKGIGQLHFLPERTCAICYNDQNGTGSSDSELLQASGNGGVVGSVDTDITNPYELIPCGCIYCYVCIMQQLEAEEGDGWICLRCGCLAQKCKPWNGDVIEIDDDESREIDNDGAVTAGEESLTEVEPRPENESLDDSTIVDEVSDESDDLIARNEEDMDLWAKANIDGSIPVQDLDRSRQNSAPISEDGYG